jgi:hypothetical protein
MLLGDKCVLSSVIFFLNFVLPRRLIAVISVFKIIGIVREFNKCDERSELDFKKNRSVELRLLNFDKIPGKRSD